MVEKKSRCERVKTIIFVLAASLIGCFMIKLKEREHNKTIVVKYVFCLYENNKLIICAF